MVLRRQSRHVKVSVTLCHVRIARSWGKSVYVLLTTVNSWAGRLRRRKVPVAPSGEDHEAPQHLPVPADAGAMGAIQRAGRRLFDQLRHASAWGEDSLLEHLPQRAAQPGIDRDFEPLLRP